MRLAKSLGRRDNGAGGVATNIHTHIQLLTLINVEVSPYGWHPWASIKAPSTPQQQQYQAGSGPARVAPLLPLEAQAYSCRFKYSLRLSVIWFPAGVRSKSSLSQFQQAVQAVQATPLRPLTLWNPLISVFSVFFSTSGRQSIDSYCALIKQQCWPILKTIQSRFK